MAEIQNTHRRVVLVHCDKRTTERVLKTARELDLFNGEKIWILLDGLLEPNEKFNIDPLLRSSKDYLPTGMLAIQNRHRMIYDPDMLDSFVELMGKAALNSYQKRIFEQQQASNKHYRRRRREQLKMDKLKSHSSIPFTTTINNNYRQYDSSSSFSANKNGSPINMNAENSYSIVNSAFFQSQTDNRNDVRRMNSSLSTTTAKANKTINNNNSDKHAIKKPAAIVKENPFLKNILYPLQSSSSSSSLSPSMTSSLSSSSTSSLPNFKPFNEQENERNQPELKRMEKKSTAIVHSLNNNKTIDYYFNDDGSFINHYQSMSSNNIGKNDYIINNYNNYVKNELFSSSSAYSIPLSSATTAYSSNADDNIEQSFRCLDLTLNYTRKQIKYRIDILR